MTKPDWTREIAMHEAAHAVACYLQGMKIDKVEVWPTNGLVKPASKPSEHPFEYAVTLLAGNEYMRSIGLPDDDHENDFVRASFVVAMQFDDRPNAASEGFGIVCEATSALVRTPRFIELVAALYPKLAEEHWHYGPEVDRFLREHDPELSEPIAQAILGAHGLTSHGRRRLP